MRLLVMVQWCVKGCLMDVSIGVNKGKVNMIFISPVVLGIQLVKVINASLGVMCLLD